MKIILTAIHVCSLRVFVHYSLVLQSTQYISVDRVEVSSPPTGVAGSPHSQATPGSPVSSSVSSTAATPLTASQHNKGIVHTCVCVCVLHQYCFT